MKKTKRKAVINLIIFFLLLAGGIYMAIAGVGQNESGKTANVPLGLDLQGGLSVTYEIQDEKPTSDEIKATVDKLQRRVDAYSSEGEVYQEGNDRITVEIPLNTEKVDAHDVLDELGQPGQLLFLDSENYTIWQQNQNNGTNDAYEAVLTGSDIKNAQAGVDDSGTVKDYVVQLQFTDEGAQKFATATAANIGKPIYIIYDGAVASAPTVQSAITDGNAVINKISSYDEAESLASTIKIGALPLELKQIQYNIVGAKLGRRCDRFWLGMYLDDCTVSFPRIYCQLSTDRLCCIDAFDSEHPTHHTDTSWYCRYYPVNRYGSGCECHHFHTYP